MVQILYVVQPFSRDGAGVLVRDPPAWSRDRSFAVSLAWSLSKRKAGVVAVQVSLEASGALHEEGEIISSFGCIPTAAILPHIEIPANHDAPATGRRAMGARGA
jgi:hypothetical protein